MEREKISKLQLVCSSIWLIASSLTGGVSVGSGAGKGSYAWSPCRD